MEYIPLEKPIADLETKIDELRRMATVQSINLDQEIHDLEARQDRGGEIQRCRRDADADQCAHICARLAQRPIMLAAHRHASRRFFCTLPSALRGNSSTRVITRGRLCGARRSAT